MIGLAICQRCGRPQDGLPSPCPLCGVGLSEPAIEPSGLLLIPPTLPVRCADDQMGRITNERAEGLMTTKYAHYFESMKATDLVRWALASVTFALTIRLQELTVKLLPESHPARPLLAHRAETGRTTVMPSVQVGVPRWAARLGQGAAIALLSAVLILSLLGTAHAAYHVKHRNDPSHRMVDVFEGS